MRSKDILSGEKSMSQEECGETFLCIGFLVGKYIIYHSAYSNTIHLIVVTNQKSFKEADNIN